MIQEVTRNPTEQLEISIRQFKASKIMSSEFVIGDILMLTENIGFGTKGDSVEKYSFKEGEINKV